MHRFEPETYCNFQDLDELIKVVQTPISSIISCSAGFGGSNSVVVWGG